MRSERYRVHAEVQFSGQNLEGVGIVRNLGLSGALIETDALVTMNDHMKLTVALPDSRAPFEIAIAVVRWVRGRKLGVEFLNIESKEFLQLAWCLYGLKMGSDDAQHRKERVA